MSHWINKTFRNTATTPVVFDVAAHIAGSFITIKLDDEVTDIEYRGPALKFGDVKNAEIERMYKWINDTFIGKPASHFHAHNGVIPDARVAARYLKPEVRIVNTVNIPNVSSPEAAEKISRTIQRTIARSTERENVGHEGFASAPQPGTYWQDNERPTRFFCVTSKSECEGHTHVSMTRVDHMRGGMYDYPYENAEQWGKMFRLVSGSSVPGNPYANNSTVVYFDQGKVRVLYDGIQMVEAADLTDAQIDALVKEHGVKYPGLRSFLTEQREKGRRQKEILSAEIPEHTRRYFGAAGFVTRKIEFPKVLGDPYSALAESMKDVKFKSARVVDPRVPTGVKHTANVGKTEPQSIAYHGSLDALKSKPLTDPLFANWLLGDDVSIPQYIQNFLDSAGVEANELPPKPGERYFSVVTGSTYTVIDVTRKLHHETDYYVTMERDGDKHRTKFTYRNHASWLVTWRPVDDEGNARKTVQVDVEQPREDSAVYDLVRIGDELEKRLPGWRKDIGHWEKSRTESDMIIRALRTLTRQRDNASMDLRKARREIEELKEQNKTQIAMAEVRNKEIAKLKQERGGSWGPERVETEQKRMRDMLLEFAIVFKYVYGIDRVKTHLKAFGASCLNELPPEVFVNFMHDCRRFVEKHPVA